MWRVTQIKTYSWDNAQVILVANKSDMVDERVVSTERGRQFADQLGRCCVYCILLFDPSGFTCTTRNSSTPLTIQSCLACEAWLRCRMFCHVWCQNFDSLSINRSRLIFEGLEFFETSAKENINVKQVFERYFVLTSFLMLASRFDVVTCNFVWMFKKSTFSTQYFDRYKIQINCSTGNQESNKNLRRF
jgi:GTPase SAR1 family protein